jgi:hypothetical protein
LTFPYGVSKKTGKFPDRASDFAERNYETIIFLLQKQNKTDSRNSKFFSHLNNFPRKNLAKLHKLPWSFLHDSAVNFQSC